MAGGARPDPFRTRKLSRRAPMVLRGKPVGEQGAADRWTALSRRCGAGPSGPRSFCFPGTPPAMVAGRAPYLPGRSEVGPGGTAGLLGHLAASRWPRPAGRDSPRPPPYVEETWRTGKTPPRRPGYGNISPCRAAPKRPAARTLRTGYCEARGRAFSMVDRRETELKNHFDGEQ